MVLSLTVENSPTLPVNGDLNTPRVVQDFPSQMEKSSVEFERLRTSLQKKKIL